MILLSPIILLHCILALSRASDSTSNIIRRPDENRCFGTFKPVVAPESKKIQKAFCI